MAQLYVLEATIVVCLMVGAVTFVATYNVPSSPDHRIERMLEQRASDLLAILHDSAYLPGDCRGRNQLDAIVIDGTNGDHTEWKASTNRTFAPGLEANLWLYNQNAYYPLHVREDFKGTTATRHLYPDWTWTKSIPSVEQVSGLEHLTTNNYGLAMGLPMRLKGEAVEATVWATSLASPATSTSWGLTSLVSPTVEETRAGAVTGLGWAEEGSPDMALAREVLPNEVPPLAQTDLGFALKVSAIGGPPAMGTRLDVRFPLGWNITEITAPNWDPLYESTAPLRNVTLQANVSASTQPVVRAQRLSAPTTPYETVEATLSNGSRSASTLVLHYPWVVDRSLPRLVFPTVPYPMVTGEPATLGVAFANGGENVTVRNVNFTIPGGYDLVRNDGQGAGVFGSVVESFTPTPGEWTVSGDGRELSWAGEAEVPAGAARSWVVRVQATSDASRASSIEPRSSPGPTANASFSNTYSFADAQWGVSPGIVRLRVPPASEPYTGNATGSNDGYPWIATAQAKGTQLSYDLRMQDARGVAEARPAYRIGATSGDVTKLESSLANSSLRVDRRMVPVGEELVVRGQMESVLTTLAQLGVDDADLTIEMYAPPSMGCTPTASTTWSVASLPAAGVEEVLVWDDLVSPGVIAATEDKRVVRLGADGARSWFQALEAVPTALLRVDYGVLGGGSAVVVGDASGRVYRIDADTGNIEWSALLSADPARSSPVVALDYDAASQRLLAATAGGVLALVAPSGATDATQYLSGGLTSAAFTPAGHVVALRASTASLHSGALVNMTTSDPVGSALGMQVGSLVLIATSNEVIALDPTTLGEVSRALQASLVRVVGGGDATGDGVNDLAFVTADMRAHVIDGTSGALAYSKALDDWDQTASALPYGLTSLMPDTDVVCRPVGYETSYGFGCEPRAAYDTPNALTAAAGRLAVAFSDGAGWRIAQVMDQDGDKLATHALPADYNDVALALGENLDPWLVVGGPDGWVHALRAETTETEDWNARPSDRIGDFQLRFLVPEGGFYGTHLLVARLSWTDANGIEQGANLADWFEAVDTDGKPVTNPAYSIVLVTRDRTSTGP